MRSKCSDDIYYRSKDLVEDRYDLMERINVFYSKRKDLQKDIETVKENDPSEEIERIEDKVKECDPMIGFMHPNSKGDEADMQDVNRNKTTANKLCKHFSKGFCKNGSSCNYSHESLDCNEHINNGKCYRNNCTQRHRQCCKFYNSRKGCDRKSNCAFLHRDIPVVWEENGSTISIENEAHIKELENSIKVMTNVINEKDIEIEHNRKELDKLKRELESKVAEIQEKDDIIRSLEDEEESTSDESGAEDEISLENGKEQNVLIGRGHFGKLFEVREGMEEEANSLRNEWRNKLKSQVRN